MKIWNFKWWLNYWLAKSLQDGNRFLTCQDSDDKINTCILFNLYFFIYITVYILYCDVKYMCVM